MGTGELILVTNFEKADYSHPLLADDWLKEQGKTEEECIDIAQWSTHGILYEAYIVPAMNYCIYHELDAQEVIIDRKRNIISEGGTQIITNNYTHKYRYLME